MSELVLTETRGRVLIITLNRPEARNALDNALTDAILDAFTRLDEDKAFSVGVVAGGSSGFCSGMDLKAFATEGFPRNLQTLYANGSKKPLIAAIEGYAAGGGLELALTCDLLVSAKDAWFGAPEVGVGLFAAGGAIPRLPRRLPFNVALELLLTGDRMTGETAHSYGLVNRVTESGKALDAALELAEQIATNAPLSIIATKQLAKDALYISEEEYWEHQRPLLRTVSRSNDAKEGPRAFAEKRAPEWSGS